LKDHIAEVVDAMTRDFVKKYEGLLHEGQHQKLALKCLAWKQFFVLFVLELTATCAPRP
jgi:hypothetical protein